eukprot:gb/GFBE01049841.1/.p1 GENE.gb/GFBE01049841.1/~~gb/GFBE01049841.1/.p1  ORF type:complete len:151 (+),score=25.64 gb/GFBE01049841.1/:1-453(+)
MATLFNLLYTGCCHRCSGVDEDAVPDFKLKTEWAIRGTHCEEIVQEKPRKVPTPMRVAGMGGIWYRVHISKKKGKDKLGVALEAPARGNEVKITAIDSDGLFGEWNKANPNAVIEKGDLIFEVNQEQGDFRLLFDMLKKESDLYIKIRRP